MRHHKLNFKKYGLKSNINILICKLFGHRLNDNPDHPWCPRCRLCHEEIYYNPQKSN